MGAIHPRVLLPATYPQARYLVCQRGDKIRSKVELRVVKNLT